MFRIFVPKYPTALEPQLTVVTDPTESQFVSEGYWIFLCSKISYILEAARFYFILCSHIANVLTFLT